MSELSTLLFADFESIRQTEHEFEFWSGRDLMPVLGYTSWRRFEEVIEKAIVACSQGGTDPNLHFIRGGRKVSVGSGAERILDDYLLTRFACYLVAQNGDSRKPVIAAAQSYFAVQTNGWRLDKS